MKAIIISIHPQWVVKILNGEKTIEVRKGTRLYKATNKLIAEQGVAPMFIYCTKDKKYTLERNTDEPYDFFTLKDKKHLVFKFDKNHCGYNGKVVARFNATAEEIEAKKTALGYAPYTKTQSMVQLLTKSCLDIEQLSKYLNGIHGTAIHITKLEIFDKPMEIKDLVRPCQEPINYCGEACLECPYAVFQQYSDYDETLPRGDMKKIERCLLITKLKAPQSWYYIEV